MKQLFSRPGDPGSFSDLTAKMAGSVHIALQCALVSVLAFTGAYYITGSVQETSALATVGALWAMISGIVVLQDTRSSTASMALLRILGSLIGAIISAIYLSFLPFSLAGMAVMVGCTVFVCITLGIPDHARLAALTVGVIMVFASLNKDINPVINAVLRFTEVLIGSVIAVILVWIWPCRVPAQGTG